MLSHKLSTLLRTLILLAVIAAGLAVSLDRALADSVCGSDPTQVGCWLFDEGSGTTTVDGSGNGNTGTLVGDATPEHNVGGRPVWQRWQGSAF